LCLVAVILCRLNFESDRPVVDRSPVLKTLAARRFNRVVGATGYLPTQIGIPTLGTSVVPDMNQYWTDNQRFDMIARADAFASVPGRPRWSELGAQMSRSESPLRGDDYEFLRLAGFQSIVCGPGTVLPGEDSPMRRVARLNDPWLADRMYSLGASALQPDITVWSVWEFDPGVKVSRAWFFPVSDPAEPGSDPRLARRPPPARRGMLDRARVADSVTSEGETVVVTGTADSPGVVVLSDWKYPGWEAELTQRGETHRVPIESAFGEWRAITVPHPGEYDITFRYRPASFRVGLEVSFGTLGLWLACAAGVYRWNRRNS